MRKITSIHIVPAIGIITFLVLLVFAFQEIHSVLLVKFDNYTNYLLIARAVVLAAIVLLLLISLFIIFFQDKYIHKFVISLISIRNGIGKLRWFFAGLFLVIPFILLSTTRFGTLITGFPSRMVILLISGTAFAYLISTEQDRLATSTQLCISFFIFGIVFSLGGRFLTITNYPFSLTWSEGNRFWDYSILFGRNLYNFPSNQPIFAFIDKGRQSLWGLPFLFGPVSIMQLRLWNVILNTVPYILFGWIVFQRFPDNNRLWILSGFWTYLFLRKGPIYTPLILSAILVALAWRRPWWIALPFITLAGYYARVTRFTWMFAPAMWAGMVYISDVVGYSPKKKNIKPIWMAVSATIAGLFGSIVIYQLGKWVTSTSSQQDLTSLSISTDYIGLDKATTIVSTQALIWQRLFPSSTNELGILLSLVLVSGPLIVFLIYLNKKGYWKLNNLAKLVIGACLILFALAGVIISVKIGGGNNLHNLDMFLIALVFCAALAWRQRADLRILRLDKEPVWVQWNWVIFLFILAFFTVYQIRPLDVVPDYFVEEVLQRINREVDLAEGEGDVLFIDHRQLLTFGYVKDIPLVDEYEKKYLMEQTFRNNENYFKNFREDMRNQRFSLIITEPLFKKLGEEKEDSGFVEENDTWVVNVSRPILCYYKKIVSYTEIDIELLIPKENRKPCEWDPDFP